MTDFVSTLSGPGVAERFAKDTYVIRRKVFKLLGAAFHIYDAHEQLVFYTKQKAFKLKEDIRLYTGEDMQHEVFSIKARQIIDFAAAYDVVDATTGEKVGGLRRQGLQSLFRDSWLLLDAADRQIGVIREDSTLAALARRFVDLVSLLFPQRFHVELDGQTVATFQQNYNPFVQKITLDFGMDTDKRLDRRLGIAAAVLLSAIEGRQR